ncbi:MAG: SDR family NAD(P)-dependent oxidoreductase [Deltaproteobacteria bacterium]|nr:MAG: SDR family NAD(P)-dependent oxidoreductase [Deltaproteobacteria bacterium]
MGHLDGKVVLITGAGGGIGRAHALACAREGAMIVVNDLGGTRDGTGASRMADEVVAEIEAFGGRAIPNYDSVTDLEGCERMVAGAIEAFGRLDVVVNNAGILRDKTFKKMTDAEWGPVIDVHLHGTRNVTKAALPALMAQGGAIINTTSLSGMLGNFGQSNYGAAKAGIYGFSRVLSLELRRAGITVNCVAPVAKTRMTEDIDMVEDEWGPEHISPIVVFLASDLGKDVTGRVFGVQGQRIHVYEVHTNDGVEKPGSEPWTADEIAAQFDAITAFETAAPVAAGGDDTVSAVFAHFPAGFKAAAASGWTANIQWKVKGGTDQTVTVKDGVCTVAPGLVGSATCTVEVARDVLVGMFTGEVDPQKAFMTGKAKADNMGDLMRFATAFDFKAIEKAFTGGSATPAAAEPAPEAAAEEPTGWPLGKRYDGGFWQVKADEFAAYADATEDANSRYRGADAVAPPMYHVRPFIGLMMKLATDPELDIDLLRLVHGEHDMTFHRLLRHGDVLQLRGTLEAVEEKSSGKVVSFGLYGFVDGEVALEGRTSYFIRGKKKSTDGPKKPKAPPPEMPAPDWSVDQPVAKDQADRYAVASGDDNPIHVDEETARRAGLPGVILHGLCTMAFAQRDLIDRLAGGDPARLKRLAVRWASPVFPGETLTLHGWGSTGEVTFATVNAAGKPVVVNGRATVAEA